MQQASGGSVAVESSNHDLQISALPVSSSPQGFRLAIQQHRLKLALGEIGVEGKYVEETPRFGESHLF